MLLHFISIYILLICFKVREQGMQSTRIFFLCFCFALMHCITNLWYKNALAFSFQYNIKINKKFILYMAVYMGKVVIAFSFLSLNIVSLFFERRHYVAIQKSLTLFRLLLYIKMYNKIVVLNKGWTKNDELGVLTNTNHVMGVQTLNSHLLLQIISNIKKY